MKNLFYTAALAVGLTLSSCMVMDQNVTPTSNEVPSGQVKVAKAGTTYILGFIPIGAVSFDTAVKGAGIKKITAVENKTTYILGFIAWKYESIIYGE